MATSLLSQYLHRFFQKPKWLQALVLLVAAFVLLVAWPLAVAAMYSLVVIKTMRSPVTRAALLIAMIAPALVMEVSWGRMVAGQLQTSPDTQSVAHSPQSTNTPSVNQPQVQGATQHTGQTAKVLQAVSGDTLDVDINGQPVRVKLLGLRAPQMADKANAKAECFAPESQMFLDSLLRSRTVTLITDTDFSEPSTDQIWRHVNMDDGTNVNQLMLEAGLARPSSDDYQKVAQYKAYAESAKAAKKGLWLNCEKTTTPTPTYTQVIQPSTSPTPTTAPSPSHTVVDPISQF